MSTNPHFATPGVATQASDHHARVDPRGVRLSATLTTLVLAAVLVTLSPVLLAVQLLVFALGALAGPQHSPYALLFSRFVRPRLGPPAQTEDAKSPRFAQAVGLGFAMVGLVGLLTGVTWLGVVAVALALVAAFLNAVFGFCLGCQLYLIGRRILGRLRLGAGAEPTGSTP